MQCFARTAAVVAILSSSLPALAQRAPDQKIYSSRTVLIFGDEGITGETTGPGMEVVFAPPKTVFPTLVRVRTSFKNELLRSVDEL